MGRKTPPLNLSLGSQIIPYGAGLSGQLRACDQRLDGIVRRGYSCRPQHNGKQMPAPNGSVLLSSLTNRAEQACRSWHARLRWPSDEHETDPWIEPPEVVGIRRHDLLAGTTRADNYVCVDNVGRRAR